MHREAVTRSVARARCDETASHTSKKSPHAQTHDRRRHRRGHGLLRPADDQANRGLANRES